MSTRGWKDRLWSAESGSCLFFLPSKAAGVGHKQIGYSGAVRVKVKIRRDESGGKRSLFLSSGDSFFPRSKISFHALPP